MEAEGGRAVTRVNQSAPADVRSDDALDAQARPRPQGFAAVVAVFTPAIASSMTLMSWLGLARP